MKIFIYSGKLTFRGKEIKIWWEWSLLGVGGEGINEFLTGRGRDSPPISPVGKTML